MTCATPDIAAATALCESTATLITAGKREGIYCSSLPSAQARCWGSSTQPQGEKDFGFAPGNILTGWKLTPCCIYPLFPKQMFGGREKQPVLPPPLPATAATQGTSSAKQDKPSVTAQKQRLARKLRSDVGQWHEPVVTRRTDLRWGPVPYRGTHISVPPPARSCRPCRARRCPAGTCLSPPRSQGSCLKHSAAASSTWPAPLCHLL